MDRLAELIGKLNEQFEQKADLSQLLRTTHMIAAELAGLNTAPVKALSNTKVAVMMPAGVAPQAADHDESGLPASQKNGQHAQGKKPETGGWLFNPMTDIPTLASQPGNREINDIMRSEESSLNEKLKENVLEVGHVLTDAPIRDLRKAIGINDRFVFVTELFRGDEVMYERSIKTINSFRIYAEAEYWIERELKIKLGWDDSREYTEHFYKLVKRRFS